MMLAAFGYNNKMNQHMRPMAVTRITESIKCMNEINLSIFQRRRRRGKSRLHRGAGVQSSCRSPEAEGHSCLQATVHLEFLLKEIVPHHLASDTPHAQVH